MIAQTPRRFSKEQARKKEEEEQAAIRIQAIFRGRAARKKASQKPRESAKEHVRKKREEEHAAIRIQAILRGSSARKKAVQKQRESSLEHARKKEEEQAAIRIQAIFRGSTARKEAAQKPRESSNEQARKKEEAHAAVRIQAIHRGKTARKHLLQKQGSALEGREQEPKEPKEQPKLQREAAAARIQAVHRGNVARKKRPAVYQRAKYMAGDHYVVSVHDDATHGWVRFVAYDMESLKESELAFGRSDFAALFRDHEELARDADRDRRYDWVIARLVVAADGSLSLAAARDAKEDLLLTQQREQEAAAAIRIQAIRRGSAVALMGLQAIAGDSADAEDEAAEAGYIEEANARDASEAVAEGHVEPVDDEEYESKAKLNKEIMQRALVMAQSSDRAHRSVFFVVWRGLLAEKRAAEARAQRAQAPGLKIGTCKLGHLLDAQPPADTGWACDCRGESFGCASGITDYFQSAGLKRYECRICDFDLCEKCYLLVASQGGQKFWQNAASADPKKVQEAALLARLSDRMSRRNKPEDEQSVSSSKPSEVMSNLAGTSGKGGNKAKFLALKAARQAEQRQ